MNPTILVQRDDKGIATITLYRPEYANALSRQMLLELNETLDRLKDDHEVRCIIITASGEKVFCAGADLKERKGMNEREVKQAVSFIRSTFSKIEALPKPVIAAINGIAVGGGLELALACDLRIASHTSMFGLPETALAIIPGAGGTQRLPRLIGMAKAKELIFTASRIDSEEAVKIGLVSKSVSPNELLDEAMLLAGQIIKNGPIAVQQAKQAINHGMETDLQTGLKIEEWCYNETIPTNDRKEGLQAFAEKRKPVYKGQ